MVTIKSKREAELMRAAGKITAEALAAVEEKVKPGVTTLELDRIAERYIKRCGASPSFKGYGGFPGSICTSVNDEIIHGIPSDRVLKEGDIISVDCGACFKGYNGDAARTFAVGKISSEIQRLLDITKQSFFEGIKCAADGFRIADISAAVQNYVEENGFSVLRDYCGHGIGREMHEEPEIPNYVTGRSRGIRIRPGMCLAVEPMVFAGKKEYYVEDNDWTVKSVDKSYGAHYENTVLVTSNGPQILTLTDE